MKNQVQPHLNGYQINFELLTQKLKEIARQKGMTQTELAEGITPRDHLNKILNGKRNPSLELLYQLCNKLHVDIRVLIEQCYFKNYEKTSVIMHDMKKCVTSGDYDKLEELVNDYKDYEDFQFGIGKQYYLHQKGTYLCKKYHRYQEAIDIFDEALDVFSSGDQTVFKATKIYTVDELSINTYKAICFFALKQYDQAISLLESITHNRLAVYESQETRLQMRAHYYLSYFLYELGHYERSLEIATKGTELGRCKFIYIYLGDLNAVKGKCYHKLGKDEKAIYYFKRAIELYQLFGVQRFAEELIEYLKQINFELDITTINLTRPK